MADENKSDIPDNPEDAVAPDAMDGHDIPINEPAGDETSFSDAGAEMAPETAGVAGAAEAMTPEEQIAELKDKLLRALAENENILRRAKREREDAAKYAAANFARDMLTVGDNLHRALAAIPDALRAGDDATKSFIEGVDMTGRDLLSVLERHGIKRLSPLGEKFNHDQHEALFEVLTTEAAPGTVVQVVEDGFMIHDRLLRPARVGVAKAAPDEGESEGHAVDTSA